MTAETSIQIDITDWVEELIKNNVTIKDEESLFDLTAEGYNAGEIARMAIAGRENGRAPDDILRPNKLLLYAGARRDIAGKHERRTLANEPLEVREYIGQAFDDSKEKENEGTYIQTQSQEGLRLATEYLLKVVPGHARRHLCIVAINGGDTEAIARELAERIIASALEIVAKMEKVDA